MDVAEEWALLCLECRKLGHPEFAAEVESRLNERDQLAAPLRPFYLAKRALAKAKLCVWHLDDPAFAERRPWPDIAETYLELGLAALEAAR
jgi:aminoglycoside phosphotransferase family enzyme